MTTPTPLQQQQQPPSPLPLMPGDDDVTIKNNNFMNKNSDETNNAAAINDAANAKRNRERDELETERLLQLGELSYQIFYKVSAAAVALLVVCAITAQALTAGNNGHKAMENAVFFVWSAKTFDPIRNPRHEGVVMVMATLATLAPAVMATIVKRNFTPPLELYRGYYRCADKRTAVYKVWTLSLVILVVSLIGQYFVNATNFMQSDRRMFCGFVYVSNMILLGLTRHTVMWLDAEEPNDVVRYSLLFEVQTYVTVANSLGALLMNHTYNHYRNFVLPTVSTDAQKNMWMMSISMTGMEGFVLFYYAFFSAQGLRYTLDLMMALTQSYLPEGHFITRAVQQMSPQYTYGIHEPWTLVILGMVYSFTAGILNPYILWEGACVCGLTALLHWARTRLVLPEYNGTATLVPQQLPTALMALTMLTSITMFVTLAPMSAAYTYLCVCLLLVTTCLFAEHMTLAPVHIDTTDKGGHFVVLNTVMEHHQLPGGRRNSMRDIESDMPEAGARPRRNSAVGVVQWSGRPNSASSSSKVHPAAAYQTTRAA